MTNKTKQKFHLAVKGHDHEGYRPLVAKIVTYFKRGGGGLDGGVPMSHVDHKKG